MPEFDPEKVVEHAYTIEDRYWEAQQFIDELHEHCGNYEWNLQRAKKRIEAVDGEIRKRLRESNGD